MSRRLHTSSRKIETNVCRNPHIMGNWQFGVFPDGKGYMLDLARAVACAWVDGYAPGLTVDHINHDRDNNDASNLQWLTMKANCGKMPWHKKEDIND